MSIFKPVGVGSVLLVATSLSSAQSITINRNDYADRLRGMWLGECLANWTGRMTEGTKRGANSFYTDSSWGTASEANPFQGKPIGFNFQNPWLTDDDTDVEYAYVHLMSQTQNPMLSEQQLTSGWNTHFTQWLFYSNAQARSLVNQGVSSASTGVPAANPYTHYIDAQLTTEIFGALAPGRPDQGLKYGMAPMLMTSRGYATHAAQYFNSMYSMAATVPGALSAPQKMQWLNTEARKFIPNTSKIADIIDFVTADFNANSDINNWESTRDKIHQRYQAQAAANGFIYRDWTESSINLATGVMALLYGNGDYKRTIQIATLSGWDSDNSTASLGGLFGLVYGRQFIVDQFSSSDFIDRFSMTSVPLSDNFNITFTGLSNMPDHVPGTAGVEDTFTQLSNRMLPIIDTAVQQMGGTVDLGNNTWTIPLTSHGLEASPTEALMHRSANNEVRLLGGTVTASSSATGQSSGDAAKLSLFADGFEHNFAGLEYVPTSKDGQWYSTNSPGNTSALEQWLAVTYSQPVWVDLLRYIEGDNSASFADIRLELLINGVWTTAPIGTWMDENLDPNIAFQIIDFQLPTPMQITGFRVLGHSTTANFSVGAAELDAFIVPEPAMGAALLIFPLLSKRNRRKSQA